MKKTFYLCDRRACKQCHPECHHTEDILHADNFQRWPTGDMAEKERNKRGWISVTEKAPEDFVSVIGHMTDAVPFPSVRECYKVGDVFIFPALSEIHPVDYWMPMPEPPSAGEVVGK